MPAEARAVGEREWLSGNDGGHGAANFPPDHGEEGLVVFAEIEGEFLDLLEVGGPLVPREV